MIRTLIWKERREQNLVFSAMSILGFVLIVGLAVVLGPNELRAIYRRVELLGIVSTVVSFTYGIVCGAMLLAGEREARTLEFLDYLEGRRLRIWTTKVAVGALLTFGLALVMAGGAAVFSPDSPNSGHWFLIVPLFGLGGFAWGLLGSALSRSVLAAVGVAAALIFVVSLFWFMFAAIVGNRNDRLIATTLIGGGMTFTVAALATSALLFCRPDWQRSPAVQEPARRPRRAGAFSLRAVLWLTYQQGRTSVLVMIAASLLLGVIIPDHALILWPLATLLLGVGCGLAVFAEEQSGEGQRFLGDQRLPVGRIWVIKTLCWLGVVVGLAAVMLLATLLQIGVIAFRSGEGRDAGKVLERLVGPDWFVQDVMRHIGAWTFLTLGLAYGFGFGQFFGLLTRKNAVAAVLAFLSGLAVAAAWLPSLLGGGVHLWQVLVVPLLLLAGIRPVLWAWAGGRVHAVRPLSVLIAGGVLALAWMAGNFWFRAVSVPDVGEPFDVRAFTASLPTPENNEAGALIRQAAQALEQSEKEVKEPEGLLGDLLEKGWTKETSKLGPWLDRMFQGKWTEEFRAAARLPLGMIVNLRAPTSVTDSSVWYCGQAANLFTARALQLMAQGKQDTALEHLGVALALSRQLRHKSTRGPYEEGLSVQNVALSAMERWLGGLGAKPVLLGAAVQLLNEHAAQVLALEDCIKAQYFVAHGERDNVAALSKYGNAPRAAPERLLLALASKAPWEEEREIRLLRLLGANALHLAEAPLWLPLKSPHPQDLPAWRRWGNSSRELPSTVQWASGTGLGHWRVEELRQADARSLCQLRGTQLIAALALYELEKGQPAATLDALVPHYLSPLPLDPYSGQPFRYRMSKGEQIKSEPPAGPEALPIVTMKVPAGVGIVWSVGPDGVDDGGTHDGSRVYSNYWSWSRGLDWIFLVPRWPDIEPSRSK